jgi:hypothetical protein
MALYPKPTVQQRAEQRPNELRGLNTPERQDDAAAARRHAAQFPRLDAESTHGLPAKGRELVSRVQQEIRPDKFNITHTTLGESMSDKLSPRRSENAAISDGPRGGRAESQSQDIGDRNWLSTFGGNNAKR